MFAVTGHVDEARKLLGTLNDNIRLASAYPVYAGLIYLGLGQRNDALQAIEESAKIGLDPGGLAQWHAFDELSADPRYRKLLTEAAVRTQ